MGPVGKGWVSELVVNESCLQVSDGPMHGVSNLWVSDGPTYKVSTLQVSDGPSGWVCNN